MGQRIKVLEVGNLGEGMYITEVDHDLWGYGELVAEDWYDASEQDWQKVCAITGYADLPTLTLAYYNGEQYTQRAQVGQLVWVLVDEDGKPVEDVE